MELGTRKSLLFYLWPEINNISKNGEANHKATLKMLRGSKSMFKDKFYKKKDLKLNIPVQSQI